MSVAAATEAAIIAGYAKKTAKEIGYENLTKPHIQAYLDRQVMIRAKQAGITPEHVVVDNAADAEGEVIDRLS